MRWFAYFEDHPHLTRLQRTLLRALLAPEVEAHAALVRWVDEIDFDALDPSSFRLMPALFKRWGHAPVATRYSGRMKGIYRYFLFRSNLVAAAARPVMSALRDAGISTVAFKGLAIGLRYHQNLALRPMSDIDILIHRSDLLTAEKLLVELGWSYRYDQRAKDSYTHSYDYVDEANNGLDLHWFTLLESIEADADERLWARAVSVDWQGEPLSIPCREDLVLIAAVNAMRDDGAMQCLWAYDVAKMLSAPAPFDWDLLWEEAARRNVRDRVLKAMQVLAEVSPEILPEERLHMLLADDPALTRHLLRTVVSETRTHSLTVEGRANADSLLPTPSEHNWLKFRSPRRAYLALARDARTPKHMKVLLNSDNSIARVYLHRFQAPLLPKLFNIADKRALAERVRKLETEGEIDVPLGCLNFRDATPSAYKSEIQLHGPARLDLQSGRSDVLPVTVRNCSSEAWSVFDGAISLYGVSCHLHDAADNLIEWEQPRTYFLASRPHLLSFVAPGQRVACDLKITAPLQPGFYRLHLDVLREYVTWFSAAGSRFPVVEMQVH